eukprot:UN05804
MLNILRNPYKIKTNPFLKVGLWVNFPSEQDYRDEKTVLQSRFEWDLENEAKLIGLESDKSNQSNIDFDLLEKEALKQNEAKKMGIEYNKDNWDNLEHENNELTDEDKELKQEEYTMDDQYRFGDETEEEIEKKKKRKYESNSDEEGVEPPNKKQRMRRHSTNIVTNGNKETNDQNKRSVSQY